MSRIIGVASEVYPSLIAEDDDGFVAIVMAEDCPEDCDIPQTVVRAAFDAGASVIVLADGRHVEVSTLDSCTEENPVSGGFAVTKAVKSPGWTSYRDYLRLRQEEQGGDPLDHVKFVHLHTHTEYSGLDGLTSLSELCSTVVLDPEGGGAVASADHGNCAAHPALQKEADKYGLKPIFGMEAYFVPDRHRRSTSWLELDGVRVDPEHLTEAEKKKVEKKSDSREARSEYTHITLWAETSEGLHNLWAMSTEAYRDGLYDGNPRLDWETLEKFSEGVICGTGCLRGPVARPLVEGDADLAIANLMRLHEIFKDNLYVEIHTNSLEDQITANTGLVEMAKAYGLPLVAAVDSHYAKPEHQRPHETWLAMQTGKVLGEETSLFQGHQDYHLKTAAEVREALAYLGQDVVEESMANTVAIARRCTARVGGETKPPTFSKPSKDHPDPVLRDVERLREVCMANWERKVRPTDEFSEQVFRERFEREFDLLERKQFCGYFLIVNDYVGWAKSHGCLVGPGRGSGGGSLVAYLADITEVDPVLERLDFERFLTEGRTSLPDFDIDFPSSWRGRIITYIKERWGEDFVANIGTVGRLGIKQAINDMVRVMSPALPYEVGFADFSAIKQAVDEAMKSAAGTGVDWDEFRAQYADVVDPLEARYPEIFAMVDIVIGRVRQYGKHAAGVVISTDEPLTNLPMRLAEDKNTDTLVLVTQFDMNELEELGFVKFDFLTIRTLDTLQVAIDLIKEKYQTSINPYEWTTEYSDPQVWAEVASGKTLGLFQIETTSGTQLTKRLQPSTVHDLAAVMTVVRPGPMRSGLTESYLRRRAGLEPVVYLDPRLEDFLGDTFGSMIYQEQVMATCMRLAGYDSTEADKVRKLLGKKQVEKVIAAGEEFVARAVDFGTDRAVAETIWSQMAEFAKYGFNKAHAFAYAMVGYWCAFLKFNYPVEFLVAALSTVEDDRVAEFVEDCRRAGYEIVLPNVNRSEISFHSDGLSMIYGLNKVKGIGEAPAREITAASPFESYEDFIERVVKVPGGKTNLGHVKALAAVGAFDDFWPNRKALEQRLEAESDGSLKICQFRTQAPNPEHPHRLPCAFDWATEPDPPMLPKGRGKDKTFVPKPPPKKCTVACRQFLGPDVIDPESVVPYNPREIMARERELLGVWITHTPFDEIPDDVWDSEGVYSGQQIESAPGNAAYVSVGVITGMRKARDRNGGQYAFVTINLKDAEIEAICFASVYEDRSAIIVDGALGVVEINKTARGYQLADFAPI